MDAGITNVDTTISVSEDIAAVNVPCYILIESELIWVSSKTNGNFTDCTRGAGGTSAASHLINTDVYLTYAANLFNQLKRAIIAIETQMGIAGGSVVQSGDLDFPTSTELTISTGSITPTQNWHTVDTESDAASDDLDTIVASGVTDGFVVVFRANNAARSVVVKHGTGNIVTTTAVDITLDETEKLCLGVYDATLTKWVVGLLGGSAAAAGGGYPMEARLTLETGVPISTTDQTAKTTLYLTKYKGDQIAVYDGSSAWETIALGADLSITLAGLTASLPYDVFVYSNAGTLTLELTAWTNTTTRATALTTQNGVYVKTGATTRRYIGTICITATTGQCEDSSSFRGVWNYYNRAVRFLLCYDTTNSWTYTTDTYRASNNSTVYGVSRVGFVVGVNEDSVFATSLQETYQSTTGLSFWNGIGLDSTSVNSAKLQSRGISPVANFPNTLTCFYNGNPAVGFHYLQRLERAEASGTATWLGDNNMVDKLQTGMFAEVMG